MVSMDKRNIRGAVQKFRANLQALSRSRTFKWFKRFKRYRESVGGDERLGRRRRCITFEMIVCVGL